MKIKYEDQNIKFEIEDDGGYTADLMPMFDMICDRIAANNSENEQPQEQEPEYVGDAVIWTDLTKEPINSPLMAEARVIALAHDRCANTECKDCQYRKYKTPEHDIRCLSIWAAENLKEAGWLKEV